MLTRNCNAYSEALCQLLLNKSIPSYVNRAAYFGSFLSCLMPSDVGSQAPVGDTGSSSSSSTRLVNGQSGRLDYSAFAGTSQLVAFACLLSQLIELLSLTRFVQRKVPDSPSVTAAPRPIPATQTTPPRSKTVARSFDRQRCDASRASKSKFDELLGHLRFKHRP